MLFLSVTVMQIQDQAQIQEADLTSLDLAWLDLTGRHYCMSAIYSETALLFQDGPSMQIEIQEADLTWFGLT